MVPVRFVETLRRLDKNIRCRSPQRKIFHWPKKARGCRQKETKNRILHSDVSTQKIGGASLARARLSGLRSSVWGTTSLADSSPLEHTKTNAVGRGT